MEAIHCNNKISIYRLINAPVPSNTFIVVGQDNHAIIVDPGSKDSSELICFCKEKNLLIDYVLLTHEHFDHCWGVNELRKCFTFKLCCSQLCKEWIATPRNYFNLLYFGSKENYSIENVEVAFNDETDTVLNWQNFQIGVIQAKGHTDKGLCYSIENCLFTGDTIIYNTPPVLKKQHGASKEDLKRTINTIYAMFGAHTMVLPGHGDKFELVEAEPFLKRYFKE